MTIINPNSISGISSITALNSTAAINLFKADGTSANIIAGVTTGSNFITGTSNVHSTGYECTNINASGIIPATTFDGAFSSSVGGSNANFTGIVTAGVFKGGDFDGRNLNISGIATFAGNVSIGGTLTYEDVTNIDSVGLITARTGIRLADDKKIILGTGGDFEIYHDTASRSGVRFTNPEFRLMAAGGTGNIQFGVSNSATELSYSALMAEFKNGAECTLNFNGSPKLATSNTGVTVTGTLAATAITGDGSGLTGIAVGLTTEALVKTNGQTASLDLSKDDHKVTATGTVTINVTGGSEGDSHSLRIENSGTANVGFSTYFKFPSGATPSLPSTGGAISLISFTVHKAGSVGIATVLLAGASVNFS